MRATRALRCCSSLNRTYEGLKPPPPPSDHDPEPGALNRTYEGLKLESEAVPAQFDLAFEPYL